MSFNEVLDGTVNFALVSTSSTLK